MQHLSLPFFGLGFDLSKSVKLAGELILCRFVQPREDFQEQFFFPWGIDLLIYLNREIRGT